MANNLNPEDVAETFDNILKVWKDNSDFKVGEWDLAKATALLGKLTAGIKSIEQKEDELAALEDSCADDAKKLNELRTRALSAIRGNFGPDSSEYERAGGTRSSERKKAVRKADAGKKADAVK